MTVLPTFTTGQVLTSSDANSMANSGLVYITSGALSSTATNFVGCFSSTYTNYRITLTGLGIANSASWLYMRYLVGTTPSATAYFGSHMGLNSVGGTSYPVWHSATQHYLMNTDSGTQSNGSFDIYNPQASARTGFMGQSTNQQATSFLQYQGGGTHDLSTQHDGLRFFADYTMNGTVTIHGYRKA
mgnify:CR=1 FL=1